MFVPCFCILYIVNSVSSVNCEIILSGPGLQPQNIVMPARYFFVNFSSSDEKSYKSSLKNNLAVEIKGLNIESRPCRIWVNKLDRKDGTFIIRYKNYETCYNFSISIYNQSKHIKGSPLTFADPILSDQCYCPQKDFKDWLETYGCPEIYEQVANDLTLFKNVDMKSMIIKIVEKYHKPESISFCHYVINNNEIYRNCYGKHIGFNMFADNILLSLTRKVLMPDMEIIINLGDWPLVRKDDEALPIFSWCGSDETVDIVMPTYDITESTLENMGRVTLDMLSVQGGIDRQWTDRESKAFWRGRDSRVERLQLIDIARTHPDLFNASLTNFFFFRNKEEQYGPKEPHISFFKFFDYKYQIAIDGTVAAYRMPYLLAGGSLVLKQDSPYYEHFYKKIYPWVHYVPVTRNLSDIKDQVTWARDHDIEAQQIAKEARLFVNENLLPRDIICYHAVLFSEWSKKIKSKIEVYPNMTHVPQPEFPCRCLNKYQNIHEEL